MLSEVFRRMCCNNNLTNWLDKLKLGKALQLVRKDGVNL